MYITSVPVLQAQDVASLVQSSSAITPLREWPLEADRVEFALAQLDQRLNQYPDDVEAQLLKSVLVFQTGHSQQALDEVTALVQREPDFHLAHLVRADMLASRVGYVPDIAKLSTANSDGESQNILNGLRHEMAVRLSALMHYQGGNQVPLQLLKLSERTRYAIIVDKKFHRLYLYEHQDAGQPPKLIRDYYISTGRAEGNKKSEGDLRTPEGVYFITTWIPDDKLPEKYGIGAFPMNYPNALDRHKGKTGNGIWLHGTDRIYYSRPPLDSEGCVVLSNYDLNKVRTYIKPGVTPIIITDSVTWVDQQQWKQKRHEAIVAIEDWRRSWESMDVDRYLKHYASNFWSGRHNLQSWSQYKRRVAGQKKYQKVEFEDLSLFGYPASGSEGRDIIVARFKQNYQSNNFNSTTQKRLYIQKQHNQWQIMYEGR